MNPSLLETIVEMAERVIGPPSEMPDAVLQLRIAKTLEGYLDSKSNDELFQLKTCALMFLIPEYRRRQREKAKAANVSQCRTDDPATSKANFCPELQSLATAKVREIMADGVARAAHEIVVEGMTASRLRHGFCALKRSGEIVATGEKRPTGIGRGKGEVFKWAKQA